MATYTSPQNGTTLDNYIASNATTSNFSTDGNIGVGEDHSATRTFRTLIQFPGLTNGTVPSGATIQSASLFLRIRTDISSNARYFRVYRSKRDVVISQCTWNIWKTSNSWATAGGFGASDCEQTNIGSCYFGTADSGWKEFALTASAIEAIVNGTWTTPTLLIKADTESDDGYTFYSSEEVSTDVRPYIVVNYTTTSIKSVNGVAYADIKTVNGVAIASVGKVSGVQ